MHSRVRLKFVPVHGLNRSRDTSCPRLRCAGWFRKCLKVSGVFIFEGTNCQGGRVHSALAETQSFRLRRKKGRQTGGRKIESRQEDTVGLHLFAWSSRDTITSDACRLCLWLCSSVVPVYPWETRSERRRLRQAHTRTDTYINTQTHTASISVLKQLPLTKPISPISLMP